MNGSRVKLRRMLSDVAVTQVVVEHRDRLGWGVPAGSWWAGMNTELIEAALAASGRSLVVVDNGGPPVEGLSGGGEVEDDLVR